MPPVWRLGVVCCECHKEYYLDEGFQQLYLLADHEYKGFTGIIKCPYCKHCSHILFQKIDEWKENNGSKKKT